jgi:hypothetical protein
MLAVSGAGLDVFPEVDVVNWEWGMDWLWT